jgi:hypothetical protein
MEEQEITIGITRKTVAGKRVDIPFLQIGTNEISLSDREEATKVAARLLQMVKVCYPDEQTAPAAK